MNRVDRLAIELQQLIDNNLSNVAIPQKKGNSIRIGGWVVRENAKKNLYFVYSVTDNHQVARTFCKASAIAIAKQLSENKDVIASVLEVDKVIQKHYNDAIFYKHAIKYSADPVRRAVCSTRYEHAKLETMRAKHKLDIFIFGT
jgi:hypothetical protein